MRFLGISANVAQKGALACARLAGHEHRAMGVLDEVPHILELIVVQVNIVGHGSIHN